MTKLSHLNVKNMYKQFHLNKLSLINTKKYNDSLNLQILETFLYFNIQYFCKLLKYL